MIKKALGIFILPIILLSLSSCAYVSTFTLTEAQIERAKTTEGFDLYVFENYMIPEIDANFDFDTFLNLFEKFELRLELPKDEDYYVARFNTVSELEEILINIENITFSLVDDDAKDAYHTPKTARNNAGRTEAYKSCDVYTSLGVTLFVEYTLFSSGSFFGIDAINRHGWLLTGNTTGAVMQSSTSSASLSQLNHGTINASGKVTIEQQIFGNGAKIVNTTRYKGGFEYNLINGYKNVFFGIWP